MSKPGINWLDIRRRYEAGEGPRPIARSLGGAITHPAIIYRAKKEGWGKPPTGKEMVITNFPAYESQGHKDTPEVRTTVLQCLRDGMSQSASAEYSGIHRDTLSKWANVDDVFRQQIRIAVRQFQMRNVRVIDGAAQRGDWRAASYQLEHHPDTKEDYAPSQSVNPLVSVVLNIDRGEPEPVTIDVTPD